jgi:hypothetical protein
VVSFLIICYISEGLLRRLGQQCDWLETPQPSKMALSAVPESTRCCPDRRVDDPFSKSRLMILHYVQMSKCSNRMTYFDLASRKPLRRLPNLAPRSKT